MRVVEHREALVKPEVPTCQRRKLPNREMLARRPFLISKRPTKLMGIQI
jgi:hypothetical protein